MKRDANAGMGSGGRDVPRAGRLLRELSSRPGRGGGLRAAIPDRSRRHRQHPGLAQSGALHDAWPCGRTARSRRRWWKTCRLPAGRQRSSRGKSKKRSAKYVQSPVVTVIVGGGVGPYSEQIRVLGEAARPQALPYRENMTLLDVMIVVGGITDFAAGNRASILRTVGGRREQLGVRLRDLLRGGDLTANVADAPGRRAHHPAELLLAITCPFAAKSRCYRRYFDWRSCADGDGSSRELLPRFEPQCGTAGPV